MALSWLFLALSCLMPVVIVAMGISLGKNHDAILYVGPFTLCFGALYIWTATLEDNLKWRPKIVTQSPFILFLKGCWVFIEAYLWQALFYVSAIAVTIPNTDNFFRHMLVIFTVIGLLLLRFKIFGSRPAPSDLSPGDFRRSPDFDLDFGGDSGGDGGDGGGG